MDDAHWLEDVSWTEDSTPDPTLVSAHDTDTDSIWTCLTQRLRRLSLRPPDLLRTSTCLRVIGMMSMTCPALSHCCMVILLMSTPNLMTH
jgi:hypothetical protein